MATRSIRFITYITFFALVSHVTLNFDLLISKNDQSEMSRCHGLSVYVAHLCHHVVHLSVRLHV